MNIIDNIPGILLFTYLTFYLVNRFKKPGTPLSKKLKREEENNLRYINFFAYAFLHKSDVEFDEDDMRKIVDYINHTLTTLSSDEPYDIVCELNVSITGKILYELTFADNKGAFCDDVIHEVDRNLSTTISKYPKYYNCHGLLRFYNDEPIFTDERISELATEVKEKIGEVIDSNNTILSEKFKALSMPEKLQFIQDYVNENGFTRLRETIIETREMSQNQKVIEWALEKLYDIQNTDIVSISEITSHINFWRLQLEFFPYLPYIPIILGSFFVHNQKYNYACYFLQLAVEFMPEHSWLYAYCVQLLSFISTINELEEELIEKVAGLVYQGQYEDAEKLLLAQVDLNPYSPLVNSEILRLQKLSAYNRWSPEKEQEFMSNYLRTVYKNCDPFFEDENILQGGIQNELNKHRKTIRDCEDLYKMFMASIYLGESLYEVTYAIMICSDAIFYEKDFDQDFLTSSIATSISKLVKEKPQKIKKILDHYVNRKSNYSKLIKDLENEDEDNK